MSKLARAKRPRRIAADEAHSWARNLRLNNPHAKLTLSMLSLYVDGDGYCFVSIPTLAEDTELSPQTVRSRLSWLEQIGAIARLPQWIDEFGRRTGDGKGKRTSDLIRLMIDVDVEEIEASANGEEPDVSREVSPMPQTGLTEPSETASPTPALRQPYDSVEGLTSEPEPHSSPLPPSRGRESGELDQIEEPEHFAPAWHAWRGHEVMRRDIALAEFRRLTPDEQVLCRAAIGRYNALLDKHHRKAATNFHMWIRQRGFREFPEARLSAPPPAPPVRRWVHGDELSGVLVAGAVAGRRIVPVPSEDPALGPGLWTKTPLSADLVALSKFHDHPPEQWLGVDAGTPQFAAWRDRLQAWLGGEAVAGERVWTEPHDPEVHDLPPIHPKFAFRKSKRVLRVPALWPPRRDGTWSETGEGDTA